MSAFGGRSLGPQLRLLRKWSLPGALAYAAVAGSTGCGGRTSMLDPDDFEPDSGGSSSGGSPSAGKGGTTASGAGASTSPSAGKGGLDPQAPVKPCASYCGGFAPLCPERLNGQECNAACTSEVNGFGKSCQARGIQALNCLAPFFQPNSGACSDVVRRSMQKCGEIVDQFQRCKMSGK